MDRVTYVTDKAYAIRSTISPSTTQGRRGQRLRTRPETLPELRRSEGRSSTTHASCDKHTQVGVLFPLSGADADAETGGLSPKLATPPGSPPRLYVPLSRSGRCYGFHHSGNTD